MGRIFEPEHDEDVFEAAMKKTIFSFLLAGLAPELHAGTIVRANPGGTQNTNVPQTFGDNISLEAPGNNVFETYEGGDGTVGTPAIGLTWSVTGGTDANAWQFHNWGGAGAANTGGGVLQLDGSVTGSRFSLTFTPEAFATVKINSFNFVGDTNSDSYQYRVEVVSLSDETVVFTTDTPLWTTDTAQNPGNTDPPVWAGAPKVEIGYTGEQGIAYRLDLTRIDDYSARPGSRVNIAVDNIDFDQLTSNKRIVWTGAASQEWSVATLAGPKNWVLSETTTPADFSDADDVRFDDSAANRTVEVDASGVAPFSMVFDFSGQYTLQGVGDIYGVTGLLKRGDGTLTISNPNTFTGGTSVESGALVVNHEEALSRSVLSTVYLSGEASFGSPEAATLGGLGGDGDIVLANAAEQPVALTLDVASDVTAVHAGELSGPGSLVKAGAGTQSLGFPGTYSGGTTIAGGILRIQDGGAAGTETIVHAGGQLRFGVSGFSELVMENDIVLPATGQQTFMVVAPGGGAPGAGATAVLDGKISGGAAGELFRLVDSGTGLNHNNVLVLTNMENDFQGTIEMWRGTLAITSDAALGDPGNGIRHLTENLGGALRFDSESIVLGAGRAIDMPAPANARPINTREFTATITGPVTGTGTLVKQGSGTLILAGEAKAHAGIVNIAEGTLRLDTALEAAANPVNIAEGGALAGTGGVARAVNVNGGTLAPGASVGTLPITEALSFGPGSRYEWEIGDWNGSTGAGYDTVTAASLAITATAENPMIVVVSPLSLVNFSDVEKTFTLVSAAGGITGFDPAAFTVDAGELPGATAHAWSVQEQGNSLVLIYGEAADTPFDSWARSKGLSGADAAFDADPDGDGIKNGLEFVLGGEPNPATPGAASTAILPEISSEGEYLVFTFRRAIAAKNLASVEYNGDLGTTWTTAGAEMITETPDGDGFERVEARIPKGPGNRLFARLRAEP